MIDSKTKELIEMVRQNIEYGRALMAQSYLNELEAYLASIATKRPGGD